MATIAQRIIQVVNATGGNKSDFARKINLSPGYISKLDKEPEREPSDRTIFDICREFDVSEKWLRTGEGEMFIQLSREEEIADFFGDVLRGEPDFKRKFVSILARMSDEEWALLEKKVLELMEELKKD